MQTANVTQMATANPTPGGFWRRVAAMFLDGVLMSIVTYPVAFGLLFLLGPDAMVPLSPAYFIYVGISQVVNLALLFVYAGFFVSKKGGTPGKLVMGLRIVDTDTGELLPFVKAGLRGSIGYFISTITFAIGYLLVAFRADKKGLHDLIFRTQVWKQPK